MMTTTGKAHPALVGETTDLFIALLQAVCSAKDRTLRRNMQAEKLAFFIEHGFNGRSTRYAELAEAAQWLYKAQSGDGEAKDVVAAVEPWHEPECDEPSLHAEHLQEIARPYLPAGSCRPTNRQTRKAPKDHGDGLQHVEKISEWEP